MNSIMMTELERLQQRYDEQVAANTAMVAFIAAFENELDGYDGGDGGYINDYWHELKAQHIKNESKGE